MTDRTAAPADDRFAEEDALQDAVVTGDAGCIPSDSGKTAAS